MKFVNAKKPRDYALEAHQLEKNMRRLRAKLRLLKEQHEQIQQFVATKYPEGFELQDEEGYLMQCLLVPGHREEIDDRKVRAFYAKQGRKVPLKSVDWVTMRVQHVLEEK